MDYVVSILVVQYNFYLFPVELEIYEKIRFNLTPNTPLIQLWSTRSKLNMDDISGFIPSCAKKVIFITEFAIWCKNPLFYEVKKIFQKRLCAWRNFKIIFATPLFIIIFRSLFHFDQAHQSWISGVLGVKLLLKCQNWWCSFPTHKINRKIELIA